MSSSTSRPRTPSRSPAPVSNAHLPVPSQGDESKVPVRKSSFSFLRRGKSTEKMNGIKRTTSTGKLTKKGSKHVAAEAPPIPVQPPKIPDITPGPKLQEFGGDAAKSQKQYNIPIPRVPEGLDDIYSRSDSMTNRGRYSYASSAVSTLNGPRRVRRRKDPTPFNILLVGARNSGKSSFGEFLRASLTLPPRKQRPSYYPDPEGAAPMAQNSNFQSEFIETEIGGERIGLTIWDSEGLEKNIVDLQLREIVSFIESKFDETLNEEIKVIRSPGVKDPHIHCVVLLLDPINLNKTVAEAKKFQQATFNNNVVNGKSSVANISLDSIKALDEHMDLQVLRALQGKTTVIPIISKADTITSEHMAFLKQSVYKQIKSAKLDPFEALGMDDNEDDEDGTGSDSDPEEVPRHNHRRFNEEDEDQYESKQGNGTSRNGGDSSSSESSVIRRKQVNNSKINAEAMPPLPLSTLTPDPIVAHQPGIGITLREFPWGSADPYNPKHCDFIRLKEAIFQEWFVELREASRELWYEGWRTSRLNTPGQRARSGTTNTLPREPTIPILPAIPKSPTRAVASSPSRNISGGYSISPIARRPSQEQFSPSSRQPSQAPQYAGIPSQHQYRASPSPSQSALQQQQAQQLFQKAYAQNPRGSPGQLRQPQPVAIEQHEVGVAR